MSTLDIPTREVQDERTAAFLGLDSPMYIAQLDNAVIVWDASGAALVASGGAAARYRDLSRGGSRAPESVALPHGLLPAPAVADPGPSHDPSQHALTPMVQAEGPRDGETPSDWLTRVSDPIAVRDWVLTVGIGSRSGDAWAKFAAAM